MRISRTALSTWTDLPDDPRATRLLLDDVGIEVKRIEGDTFVLELLANRGDHHGMHGLARELAGRTGAAVRLPPVLPLPAGGAAPAARIEDARCFVYQLTLLEGPAGSELTAQQLSPWLSTGQKSVGAAVDATNLASLEFGQPTHAFDADRVVGPVRVRASRPGEQAWLLFTVGPTPVPTDTLVIADDVQILAIAGVIGCEPSKTTVATTRILLESAGFDPVSVRRTARALGQATDASARFERGSDVSAVPVGAGRVAWLLGTVGWTVRGTTVCDPPEPLAEPAPIELSLAATRAALALPALPADEIRDRLSRYGYGVTGDARTLQVGIPPHRRWDVAFVDDLYEDLARSIGYDALPTRMPSGAAGASPSPRERARDAVDEVVLAHGFYEVITDGFYGRAVRERLGITPEHPLWDHVETTNALDRSYSLLKNQALAQAMDGVSTNVRMRTPVVRMFEWTRTFHPDPSAGNGVCRERALVWGIAAGHAPDWAHAARPADVFLLKGLVLEIGAAISVPLEVRPGAGDDPLASLLHPGRAGSIWRSGRRVGVLGEVHPEVVAAYKLKRVQPVYFELDADVLVAPPVRAPFVEPSAWQPVDRSLAFTLPGRVSAGSIVETMRAAGPSWLRSIHPVDLYLHEVDGAPARTVTFALVFDQEDPPRTSEVLNGAADALVQAVLAAHGPRGVVLRS